ncbi:hypothetical protein J4216_04655 [Candidatus Woesearchaeota archaeon]|nr:hypothetical protein [Candidatus Woesearchaeota archaeon]
MKKILRIIVAFIAILIGIYSLFKITPTFNLAADFFIISFGFLALIWSFKAYRSLAQNSSLRSYSLLFVFALLAIFLNKLLTLLRSLNLFNNIITENSLMVIGYLLFALSAYKILMIGKEFGFAESANMIEEALKEKKKKRSK